MGWGTKQLWFNFEQGQKTCHFWEAFTPNLRPTQPPVHWVPMAFSPGIKQLECEGDHSPPFIVKVQNAWSYNSLPPFVFTACRMAMSSALPCTLLAKDRTFFFWCISTPDLVTECLHIFLYNSKPVFMVSGHMFIFFNPWNGQPSKLQLKPKSPLICNTVSIRKTNH